MNKCKSFIDKFGLQILGVVIFLILAEIVAIVLGPYKLPRMEVLAVDFVTYLTHIDLLAIQGGGDAGFLPHLTYTVGRTLLGALIGLPLGVILGLVISKNEKVRAFCKHIVGVLRIIPPLVVTPFFLMWFGPTSYAQTMMVVFYCTSMMLITTTTAVSNVEDVYVNYGYTLGAGRNAVYSTIILPMIVPELIGGLRVALGASWGIQVVTELMGSPLGMGQVFSMMIPMQSLDIIICGILWIALAAVAVDLIMVKITNYFTAWAPTAR